MNRKEILMIIHDALEASHRELLGDSPQMQMSDRDGTIYIRVLKESGEYRSYLVRVELLGSGHDPKRAR